MKIKYIEKPEIFVVTNQSFEQLAQDFDVSVLELKKINNVQTAYKGLIISFPDIKTEQVRHYIVKPADTIEKIAQKLGVNKYELQEKNNIRQVFVGQMLFY